MERAKSLLRNIDEAKGMVIEVMEREINARYKAVGGNSEDITNLGKDLERYKDESGTAEAAFASAKATAVAAAPQLDGGCLRGSSR